MEVTLVLCSIFSIFFILIHYPIVAIAFMVYGIMRVTASNVEVMVELENTIQSKWDKKPAEVIILTILAMASMAIILGSWTVALVLILIDFALFISSRFDLI